MNSPTPNRSTTNPSSCRRRPAARWPARRPAGRSAARAGSRCTSLRLPRNGEASRSATPVTEKAKPASVARLPLRPHSLLHEQGNHGLHRCARRTAPAAARRTGRAGPASGQQARGRDSAAARAGSAPAGRIAPAPATGQPDGTSEIDGGEVEGDAIAAGDIRDAAAQHRPDQEPDQLAGAQPAERVAQPPLWHLARHQRDRRRGEAGKRPHQRAAAKNCQTFSDRPINTVNKPIAKLDRSSMSLRPAGPRRGPRPARRTQPRTR